VNRHAPAPSGLIRIAAAGLTGVFASATLLVGPLVPAVAADATIATTTTLNPASLNPKPVGRTAEIVAVVTPESGSDPSGTMTLYDDDGVTRTQLDQKPLSSDPFVLGEMSAHFTLAADMAAGTYHLLVAYGGDATFIASESAKVTVVVGPRPTSTTVELSGPHDASGATAQKGDTISVVANVLDTGDYTPNEIPIVGDITIEVDGVVKATTTYGTGVELSTATWSLGSHTVKATYAGDGTDHSGSNGSTTIMINASVVEATGVGVSLTTFYPYKDGYKDTVAIRGNRGEPISVTIRIYSPTGKLVRTFSVAAGSGAYSVAWNGRTATGTALAAGKYKVVQTLKDNVSSIRAFTSYTTISSKRLYTYTKTITKDYAHRSAQATYSVAWDFTLPSATVYKKLVFGVYAKSSPSGAFGPHDFALSGCGRTVYALDCGYPGVAIGSTLAWRNVTGSSSANRSGTLTRLYGYASVRTNLKQGRVTVTYAILK
jgi:flagellar hook assembly protein FlgD